MAKNKPPAPNTESLEGRVMRLEKELRDAMHKNDALKTQSFREKEDFERQISRLKEDMVGEAKRMGECVEEARRSRDELRQALGKKDKALEQAKSRVADCKGKLGASRAELAKLRAQMTTEPSSVREDSDAPPPAVETPPTAPPKIKIKTENVETPRLKRPTTYHAQSSSSDEANPKRRKMEHREENNALDLPSASTSTPAKATRRYDSLGEKKRVRPKNKNLAKDTADRPLASTSGIPVVITASASSLSALQQRIAAVTTFTVQLPSKISPMGVSRAFLVAAYGIRGSMFGKIMPEMNVPRGTARPIILPRLEFSPGLPSSPGAPGTMLTNRPDILHCGPVSLWIKAVPGEGLWKYFGNYDFVRSVQPLTAAEARSFDESTVSAWALLLSSNAWDSSHAELRARLWLHKVGAAATETVVAHHVDLLRTKKSPIDLNKSDISEALQSWKETLHVVTMRCVGYDYDFLADMETRWRKWQAVQPEL